MRDAVGFGGEVIDEDAVARTNLAQIESWSPRSDHGRRMKALNLRQLKAWLERPFEDEAAK